MGVMGGKMTVPYLIEANSAAELAEGRWRLPILLTSSQENGL
jgi:hypothetical protein